MQAIFSGPEHGAIYYLEFWMQRNLSRALCLLHFIELPMKIFKTEYIGETKGPNSREGHLPQEMVKFTPIAVKNSYSSLKKIRLLLVSMAHINRI